MIIDVGTSLEIQYLKTVLCTPAEFSEHLCSCATCLPGKEIKWRADLSKIRVFRISDEKNECVRVRYVMAGNPNELCSVLGRACSF